MLEHFGPNVHAASVVKIIEVAQTDIPVAEANLHHPFAVPPVPRDTGKAGPVGLGMAALPCGTEVSVETGSAALCVDWRSIHAASSLPRTGDPAKASTEIGVAAVGSA